MWWANGKRSPLGLSVNYQEAMAGVYGDACALGLSGDKENGISKSLCKVRGCTSLDCVLTQHFNYCSGLMCVYLCVGLGVGVHKPVCTHMWRLDHDAAECFPLSAFPFLCFEILST